MKQNGQFLEFLEDNHDRILIITLTLSMSSPYPTSLITGTRTLMNKEAWILYVDNKQKWLMHTSIIQQSILPS